jgi:hypothetical protein
VFAANGDPFWWGRLSLRLYPSIHVNHIAQVNQKMNSRFREKAISVCDAKISQKGANVGLSFYAFFKNKNDDPELLMAVAQWWIKTHKLDHFEKATKIKELLMRAA